MFCESFPALEDRHIKRIQAEVPLWLGKWHDGKHELRLAGKYGGGVLCLRNLDETQKYLSVEFAGMGIDELTQNPEMVYDFLNTRLRWPGLPAEEYRIRSGTNPGGPGHLWVKRRWVERGFAGKERPGDYAFVPAKVADNPHLPPGYADTLAHLPEMLRKAYLEGSWELFAGQMFPEWDPEVHLVEAMPEGWEKWPKFRCIDYGYSAPSAVYWVAEGPDRTGYVYRELYEAGLGPAGLADAIVAMSPKEEGFAYTVADPSLFKHNEQTHVSNAWVLAQNGVECLPGLNDRISGWRQLHDYLRVFPETDEEGRVVQKARLRILRNACPNLVRTLPALVYSQTRTEDADSSGDDHGPDSIRYWCMSRPPLQLRARVEEEEPEPELPADSRKLADIIKTAEGLRPRELADEYTV